MAVTGLVVPYELETEAQILFERQGSGHGFERKWHRFGRERKMHRQLVNTRLVGTGANMAYRRCLFDKIGDFNPALDVDDVTHGGGDLEMFFRVLNGGHTLVYEPSAIVRHRHCREHAQLTSQIADDSIGLFSYLVCGALAYPDKLLAFIRVGLWYIHRSMLCWLRPTGFPRDLILAELRGFFVGLGRYQIRKTAKQTLLQVTSQPVSQAINVKTFDEIQSVAVRTIELSQPLQALTNLEDYKAVRVFVTWNNCFLGSVDIANEHQPIRANRLRQAIVDHLWLELLPDRNQNTDFRWANAQADLKQYFTPAAIASRKLPTDIPVSIVVATYDRPGDLRNCLNHLVVQETPRLLEIIIADNHPASGLTAPVVAEFPGVKLVSEARKGASYARNAGFIASSGDIVVSVDDDVTVPPDWLEKLIAPLSREEVMVVTGNVLPLELETPAQWLFEKTHNGLSQGVKPFEVDGDWLKSFQGYSAPVWELGVSANAAYRAHIFSHPQIGLMDEVVSTGTPAGGGEEPYLFYKLLKVGYTLVYEPSAYVWHKHRRDLSALHRQMYCYSKSCIAYNLAIWLRDRDRRGLRQLLVDLPRYYIRKSYGRLRGWHDCPWSLIWMEVKGYLTGPWSLWQSYQSFRRTGRSAPYIPVRERGEWAMGSSGFPLGMRGDGEWKAKEQGKFPNPNSKIGIKAHGT